MSDIAMIALILVFFFAAIGYVGWCGRIIGPDPEEDDVPADSAANLVDSNS
jgi:hypothetical protein